MFVQKPLLFGNGWNSSYK